MPTNSTIQFVDRRQGRRILTMKNALVVFGVVVFVFATISVFSEFRGSRAGELGRLYEKRPVVAELEVTKPAVVIKEGDVADHDLADPLTVESMRLEQYLGVSGADPLDPRNDVQLSSATGEYLTPEYRPADPLALKNSGGKEKARFAIEGGAGGVYTRLDQ